MKKIKICILLVISLFELTSCALESEVYDSINGSIFPTTESDAEALVTGNAYSVFMNNGLWVTVTMTIIGVGRNIWGK